MAGLQGILDGFRSVGSILTTEGRMERRADELAQRSAVGYAYYASKNLDALTRSSIATGGSIDKSPLVKQVRDQSPAKASIVDSLLDLYKAGKLTKVEFNSALRQVGTAANDLEAQSIWNGMRSDYSSRLAITNKDIQSFADDGQMDLAQSLQELESMGYGQIVAELIAQGKESPALAIASAETIKETIGDWYNAPDDDKKHPKKALNEVLDEARKATGLDKTKTGDQAGAEGASPNANPVDPVQEAVKALEGTLPGDANKALRELAGEAMSTMTGQEMKEFSDQLASLNGDQVAIAILMATTGKPLQGLGSTEEQTKADIAHFSHLVDLYRDQRPLGGDGKEGGSQVFRIEDLKNAAESYVQDRVLVSTGGNRDEVLAAQKRLDKASELLTKGVNVQNPHEALKAAKVLGFDPSQDLKDKGNFSARLTKGIQTGGAPVKALGENLSSVGTSINGVTQAVKGAQEAFGPSAGLKNLRDIKEAFKPNDKPAESPKQKTEPKPRESNLKAAMQEGFKNMGFKPKEEKNPNENPNNKEKSIRQISQERRDKWLKELTR